jgi:hypothetical protein
MQCWQRRSSKRLLQQRVLQHMQEVQHLRRGEAGMGTSAGATRLARRSSTDLEPIAVILSIHAVKECAQDR